MLRLHRLFPLLFLSAAGACIAFAASPSSAAPEAVLVIVGDQHSAYERIAQFLARVDRLRELTGEQAQALLARANQGPDTPFEQRSGENLIVAAANEPVAGRNYRFVTTDWVAKNARMYLGENLPALAAHPHLALKAAVLEALSRQE